jgi:hypothetical protein
MLQKIIVIPVRRHASSVHPLILSRLTACRRAMVKEISPEAYPALKNKNG